MKKISILLMLMALFGPLAMMGQSTYSWGSSSTNSGTDYNANPFGRFYGYEYRVYLYPPNTMPFSGNITQLEFLPAGDLSAGGQIDVWMKTTTTTTSLSNSTSFATYKTGATQVYTSSSSPAFTEDNYVAIPLSTPIAYNYNNNEYLMILVRSEANSTSGDGGRYFYYYNPSGASNNTWWAKKDSSDPGESATPSSFTSNGTGIYLPVVRFTYTGTTVPTISLSPSSATVVTGSTQALTATYGNVTNPTITYSSSNTSVATVTGSGTSATVTGVAAGTATITATMNGTYTATCVVTVENPSYCTPHYSQTSDYIKSFVTTGGTTNISNTNTGQGTGGYSDFYNNYSASIDAGETLSFTVTRGYNDSYKYAIWVDWNHDYVFDVNTETVASVTTSQKADWSGSFTIPANAAAGDYRMRVEMLYGSSNTLNPCVSANYGEVEDYKLTVLAASNCPTPTPGNVTDLMPTSATLNWTGNADDYYVRYRTAAQNGAVFFEGFENGLPSTWTTVNSDGDDYNWAAINNSEYANTGSGCMFSYSYAGSDLDPDEWLITPQVKLQGTLKFWVKSMSSYYPEKYAVYVSTGDGFVMIGTQRTADFAVYTEIEIDLSGYNGVDGYIAIRHYDSEGMYIFFLDDFGIYVNEPAGQWIPNATGANTSDNSHDITGLTPETEYEWQVMADCGTDGESGWSAMATFTTPSACTAPFDPNTTDITANSAKLNWTGYQDEYNVIYGKVLFYEGFENGLPSDWTTIRNNEGTTNTDWHVVNSETVFSNDAIPAHSGTMVAMSRSYSGTKYNVDNWLITPQVTLDGTLSFWVMDDGVYHEHYDVYVSTNSNSMSDFTLLYSPGNATSIWTEVTVDLSSYQGALGYIALRNTDEDQDFLFIDDFGIYKDLQSTTSTANNVTVYDLTPETDYIWKVQGADCDGNGGTTDWSEYVFFTTTNVGYVLHIDGYNDSSDGWYLIASPIGDVLVNDVTNLKANQFDLYYFDQTKQPYEWINYYQGTDSNFNSLLKGKGYLYANSGDVDLVFNGTAYNQSGDVTLVYSEENSDSNMWGWNLVGNPFAVDATVNEEFNFMEMNDVHSDIVPNLDYTVAPMEGIFVQATQSSQSITFTKVLSGSKATTNSERIMINISQDQKVIDRAIVRFGEGNQMPKYQLRQNSTKIYFPVDGEDFAVVRSEGIGELPVSFKAEENGNYTLSLNANGVNFGYLHLIDNMTGNDVDMLATPSYSFEARTSDYSHRFKLVFATGDNANDTFTYFSNGSFVINNDGKATLQVIDITGRILKSESINGCANLNFNAAPGVYMIRLVNGTDVKVQKVVVK